MQLLTIGNGTSRDEVLQFEFNEGSYNLKVPRHGEIAVQFPAQAVGALLAQNQHIGLKYVDGGQRTPACLWFKIGGGL